MNWRKIKRLQNILRKKYGIESTRSAWSAHEDCYRLIVKRSGLAALVGKTDFEALITGLAILKGMDLHDMARAIVKADRSGVASVSVSR